MNHELADGAHDRLDAQIAEALFGQPGMSKMDVANLVRDLRGDGPALLVDGPTGGSARLGDSLPPLPCSHYNACGDGSEPLYTSEQMRDYARAALSAQPSPGGQDALREAAEFARSVLAEIYATYQVKIGPFASQAQLANVKLGAALAARQPVGDQHPDDVAVDAFAATMKAKMAEARAKGPGGWEDPTQCSGDDLTRMLRDHVEKGDPRDVANFCMMLHQRGEAIAARQPVGQEPAMYQVRPRSFDDGEGWREVTKREYDDRGPFPGYDEAEWERRTLYASPPARAVDDRFPNGLPDAIEYADEMEEAASAVYEKVFGHEDDGEDCGTVVLRRVLHHLNQQPAQAVDQGRWSQGHAEDLEQAIHTALSAHAGSLSQKKRKAISDYVKRLLIDSQAVGNG